MRMAIPINTVKGERHTNIIRGVLSMELVASGLFGLQILVNDKWLWSSAPSHAYGLLGFVAIDILIGFAVIRKLAFYSTVASIAALVQVGSMLSDLFGGQPMGVSSIAFRNYLLRDSSFLSLMGIQILIILMVLEMTVARLLHLHHQWPALLHRS